MYYSALSQLLFHVSARTRSTPCRVTSPFAQGARLSVLGLLWLFLSSSAFAGPVTLAWNAVSAPGLAGYRLYYGYASGSYSVVLDVGNSTTAALSGLDVGRTYYFATTAYDGYGDESAFSNQVSYVVPAADTTPPTVAITSPVGGALVQKKSTVTISATASDNVGVTKVEFYINGQLTCSDTAASYTCAWKVPAAPGRSYQLQAKAYDAQGNVSSSSIVTVTSQ
jgi:chitinase